MLTQLSTPIGMPPKQPGMRTTHPAIRFGEETQTQDPLEKKVDELVRQRIQQYEKAQRKKELKRTFWGFGQLLALAGIFYFGSGAIDGISGRNKPYVPQGIDANGLSDANLSKRPGEFKALQKSFENTISPLEAHFKRLAELTKPAVVQIHPDPKQLRSLGSGVIIREDGIIITNAHVVNSAPREGDEPRRVLVTLYNGERVIGKVLGIDEETDLAVVKIDEEGLPTLKLAKVSPKGGEMVMTVGHPMGLGWSTTMGIISGNGRAIEHLTKTTALQTDADISPGNSGGPLVNMKGEVVGLNQSILYQMFGASYSSFTVPVETIHRRLPELMGEAKQKNP